MRWTPWTALAASLAALAVAAATLSCATTQEQTPAPMTQQQKLERGEYLAIIGGCNDCHTPGAFYGSPDFDTDGWRGVIWAGSAPGGPPTRVI